MPQRLHELSVRKLRDEAHVHELFVVASDGGWHVAKQHIKNITAMFEGPIIDGSREGFFSCPDASKAAHCVTQAVIALIHPRLVEQRANVDLHSADPEALTRFIVRALGAHQS